jgi:hypothetical protein
MSRHRSRRVAALALATLAVAGLSTAAATQLTVTGRTLQSGVGTLADCQPTAQTIGVRLTSAFSTATGTYATTAVTFGNVAAACNGRAYRVQLLDPTGTILDTNGTATAGTDVTGTVSLASGAFTVTVASTATASIGSAALVLTG